MFFVRIHYVASGVSMQPDIRDADIVIFETFRYWVLRKRLKRFEIVAFPVSPDVDSGFCDPLKKHLPRPQGEVWYIKRVVGLPGEKITIKDGHVYIDDMPLNEPRANPQNYRWGPKTVPGSAYFVLGDNRQNSCDSRGIGFIPKYLIKRRFLFKLKREWIPNRYRRSIEDT